MLQLKIADSPVLNVRDGVYGFEDAERKEQEFSDVFLIFVVDKSFIRTLTIFIVSKC